MAERCSIGRLHTPVADVLALTHRSFQGNLERDLLANLNLTTDYIALSCIGDVGDRTWALIVDIEHIVAANEADAAASRPGV